MEKREQNKSKNTGEESLLNNKNEKENLMQLISVKLKQYFFFL